jgi:mannose-6-phosphate isomerase-like protein (cupin superfamily)
MIIKSHDMQKEVRKNMRNGQGEVTLIHLVDKDSLKNARLLSKIIIPPGAGIGDHEHANETEYYIITNGAGIVVDDGAEKKIEAGDVVVTGGGASHSIRNSGNEPLELYAVIITY